MRILSAVFINAINFQVCHCYRTTRRKAAKQVLRNPRQPDTWRLKERQTRKAFPGIHVLPVDLNADPDCRSNHFLENIKKAVSNID